VLSEPAPRVRTSAVVAGLVGLWLCWGTSFSAIRVMVAGRVPRDHVAAVASEVVARPG
jgi:hypothetical protein